MPRFKGTRRWLRLLVLAGVVALAAAAWIAWPPRSALVADIRPPDASVAHPRTQVAAPAPDPGAPVFSPASNPPLGVSAEQWRDLQAALAEHPQRDAEITRIVNYLSFADRVQRLRMLIAAGGEPARGAEAQALAREIDRALPERLARRELSATEALFVKQQVLEVLLPDPTERQAQLERWQRDQRSAEQTAAATAGAREATFLQEQQAIVAAWQALPESARDPKDLEARLEALRQSHFDGSPSRR